MNVQTLYLNRKNEFINLLPRDWELLSFLEQQGFATFKQLESRYFKNHQNCSLRLKKLMSFGYIESKSILEIIVPKHRQQEGNLFPYISEIDVRPSTQAYYLSPHFRRKYAFSEGLLKSNMVMHQLILGDLRTQLEKEIPHNVVLSDPHIKVISKIEIGRHENIRPDLSMELNGFKLAVELERTTKTRSRYYERFLYYQDSVYSHVLYVTTDRKNIEYLIEQVAPYKKIGVAYFREPFDVYHNYFGLIKLNQFLEKVRNK